jgi:Dolichyl-phosphate-mannose-protein mannosyltransferase
MNDWKNIKLKTVKFQEENRRFILLVALGFVLVHSAAIVLVGISKPLLDLHDFRQTQTALSAYWIMHDGISLAYETPVLGYPWRIPLEFPFYQWIVALLGLIGIPIEIAGRLVSYCFFIACLWPIWMIFRFMKLKTEIFFITAILFLSSPLYLFWSRTVMIESTSLFFAALWLALLIALLTKPKTTWLSFIVVVAAGTIAGLVKITTLPAFYFLGGLFFLDRAYITWREGQISDCWKTFAFAIAACSIPIVITYAWVLYSDAIKAAGNEFAQGLTSSALSAWNFGTIRQRLAPSFWEHIVGRRVLFDLFGYGAILTILVAGTVLINSRYVLQMLGAGFAFLIPFLLFTNLHWQHNYYQYANGVFLIVLVGFAITNLFDANRTRLGISLLALIVAGRQGRG